MFQPDPDGKHEGQWYLRRANFPEAWRSGATGDGVIIGIVDNTFGQPHPDIEPARHHSLDGDFSSEFSSNRIYEAQGVSHGLMVAGIAAARGGNGIGITGAAPHAQLIWIRSGGPAKLDEMIRYSPEPGPPVRIRNYSIGSGLPYKSGIGQGAIRRAFRETQETGILHVIAAGNEGGWAGGDCGKSVMCASPHVIVVAACDRDGRAPTWTGYGGTVVASAPSALGSALKGILTVTDVPGLPMAGFPLMTTNFGGASAATPLVSGLLALGVEVEPQLDTRLAKHLLALTCRRPEDGTPEQEENAAGQWHSPRSGFGMIDAGRFVAMAKHQPRLTTLRLEPERYRDDELGLMPVSVQAEIPDGNLAGITQTFMVVGGQRLEEVEISLEIRHPNRGQLSGWLQSPSGTRRELFDPHPGDHGADIPWIFVTHAFWGEEPKGEWRLMLVDSTANEAGNWVGFGWRMRMGRLEHP